MSWLVWYLILSHCVFTFILYRLTEDLAGSYEGVIHTNKRSSERTSHITYNIENLMQGSSVWCFGHQRKERICKFRNLCYSSNLGDYLFFHGPSTVMQGVPSDRCNPALLDLSSVDDHNLQYFNYQDAPVDALKHFPNITMIDQPSLVFHRFNPDNLMHIIHDDLLPLFYTLKEYFPDFSGSMKQFRTDVQFVFMEGRDVGPHFDLYEIFSTKKSILFKMLKNNSLTCLQDSVVGISKATTWYDYGFKVPQGPRKNHTSSGHLIHQFGSYVTTHLRITSKTEPGRSDYVILFSREFNRLILNELELSFAIATTFNLKVIRLSLETNNVREIITMIRNCAGIIGMHGSILSLAVFLLPGSFLVELFPYAVNPDNYTPYKTLAQIPDMEVSYGSWQNKIKENNVAHPNRTPDEGGILHLSLKEQNNILNAEEVSKHLCCDDPYWLFRIYQDTTVDTKSFIQVMQTVLNATKISPKQSSRDTKAYPGKIRSLFCDGAPKTTHGPAIFVSWQSPWNIQFFYLQDVGYEVWIQNKVTQEYMAYALNNVTQATFTDNVDHETSYSVWVRGLLGGNIGPFSNVCFCTTH